LRGRGENPTNTEGSSFSKHESYQEELEGTFFDEGGKATNVENKAATLSL